MDLSLRNAKYFRMEKFKQMKIVDPDRHIKRIMSQMKNDLRLPNEPSILNVLIIQIPGYNPVAACVVLKMVNQVKKNIAL